MNTAPLISILMGVRNGQDRLETAIASILAQTYTHWEFIICDDGSTDESYERLLAYARQDMRFVILRNSTCQGLAATLNHCLHHTKGVFIARMDDDDISYSQRFEKQLSFLQAHPQIGFVSSSVDIFDGTQITRLRHLKEFPTKYDLIWNSAFVHPATLFRADVLRAVGGYRIAPETVRGQDYDLFMRLYGAGFYGANLQEAVYRYTVNPDSYAKRTFQARRWEAKIRRHGFKAMGIWWWAWPFVFKPFVAHLLTALKRVYLRRKSQ